MVQFTIRVDVKTGQTYLPRVVREAGFTGRVGGLVNAMTVILMRPEAKLRDIHASLRIIRDDINLRMVSDEKKRKSKGEEPHSKPTAVQERGSRYPLFNQFSRKWLTEVLGYSEGHLCRIATGDKPLSKSFIARCCYRLKETELELFDTSSGL